MQHTPPLFLMVTVLAGVSGVAVMVIATRLHPLPFSRARALVAALPAVVTLASFYSLAVHMHRSLGDWPGSIGTNGFPSALVTHAEVTGNLFSLLLLGSMFAWSPAVLLSALIDRCRGALPYLGVFALSCFACFAAMLLAPSPFLYWWWD